MALVEAVIRPSNFLDYSATGTSGVFTTYKFPLDLGKIHGILTSDNLLEGEDIYATKLCILGLGNLREGDPTFVAVVAGLLVHARHSLVVAGHG